ncbi:hypothetical protein ACWDFH_29225, partial [Streptomyces kronopolitis]
MSGQGLGPLSAVSVRPRGTLAHSRAPPPGLSPPLNGRWRAGGGTDTWTDFAVARKGWGYDADRRPSTHPV